MYTYYLDNPFEIVSSHILSQLNILFCEDRKTDIIESLKFTSTIESSNQLLIQEHNCLNSIVYEVIEGEAELIFRDFADCWICCKLKLGNVITLPPSLYRKFIFNEKSKLIQFCSEENKIENFVFRYSLKMDSIFKLESHKYRELICELCKQFFDSGWVTGTGGSISIRYGNRIYMTPSGVQKERLGPEDIFTLDYVGNILFFPRQKTINR